MKTKNLIISRKCGIHHRTLLLLQLYSSKDIRGRTENFTRHHYLNNAALYTVFNDELDGLDRTFLSKTMDSIHRFCKIISIAGNKPMT